jgi:hypothetical protein
LKKNSTFPISSSNKSEEQKLDIPSSLKLQKPSEISISMTKSKDMKLPHLPNTENVFSVKGSVCEDDSIDNATCEQDAQTDATRIQEDINNSVYRHDSICEQDDSFVVIDNNSNIHDNHVTTLKI